jgi:hypothetical protein
MKTGKHMCIISVSLPNDLLEDLDAILGEERSATRSEVLRQAIRTYLIEYKEIGKLKGNRGYLLFPLAMPFLLAQYTFQSFAFGVCIVLIIFGQPQPSLSQGICSFPFPIHHLYL